MSNEPRPVHYVGALSAVLFTALLALVGTVLALHQPTRSAAWQAVEHAKPLVWPEVEGPDFATLEQEHAEMLSQLRRNHQEVMKDRTLALAALMDQARGARRNQAMQADIVDIPQPVKQAESAPGGDETP